MTLPLSWATQGRELADVLSVVGTIPNGTKIYFNEHNDGRNERWSSNANSATIMRFEVNSDALRDLGRRRILMESILGGYSITDGRKHTPYRHPYALGCYAKDIVSIEHKGANTRPSGGAPNYLEYSVDIVTVSFESLPYEVDKTGSGTFSYNWMEAEVRPAGSRVQSPLGWYIFTEGTYTGWASLLGSFVSMPTGTLVLTLHQCEHNTVFSNGTSLKPSFMSNFGQVNSQAILGYAAESLLLAGAEIRPYHNMMGDRLYDVRLIFDVNDWTWNKSLDPGNTPRKINLLSSTSGIKPFTTFGLGTLLTSMNPV